MVRLAWSMIPVLAAMPGVVPGQGKTACELVTKADVEAALGIRVLDPQPRPAPVPTANQVQLTSVRSSSSCMFAPVDANSGEFITGAQITVSYVQATDANQLLDQGLKQAKASENLTWRDRNINYPALWDSDTTLVAYKEEGGGTTVVQARILGGFLINGHSPSKAKADDKMDRAIRIALKALGGAGKLPGTPNSRFVSPGETLRGHNEMVVEVWVNGIEQVPEDRAKLAIEQTLRQNGIKVLRENPASQVPVLRLNVSDATIGLNTGTFVRLEFLQPLVFSGQGTDAKFVMAPTWSAQARSENIPYWDMLSKLTPDFVRDYGKANPPGARR